MSTKSTKQEKGKQNEKEHTAAKMFSEKQERVQKKENSAQKCSEKQETTQVQKKSEANKMKELAKYLLIGGMFLMAMTFGMLWGYRDAHPGEDMSFAYIPLLCNILIGVLIGLGVPLIIKISQIIKKK